MELALRADMEPREGGGFATWQNVLRAGVYEKQGFFFTRKFSLTPEVLQQMVDTLAKDKERLGQDAAEIPVDYNHAFDFGDHSVDANAAAAWLPELRVDGEWLQALFVWTQPAVERIKLRLYKRLSAVFSMSWVDEGGIEHNEPRLHAVTLTNRPFLRFLGDVRLSDGPQYALTSGAESVMLMLNCEPEESTMPFTEKDFVALQDANKDLTAKVSDLCARLDSSEKTAKELSEKLSANADATKRLAEIEEEKAQREAVDAANGLFEAGQITKAQTGIFSKLFRTDRAAFDEYAKTAEKKVALGERSGSDGAGDVTPGSTGSKTADEAYFELCEKIVKTEKCSFDDAAERVAVSHPDVAAAYANFANKSE